MQNTIERFIEIAKQEPVIKRMWVFGSRYKGTGHPDSDLDLAVEVAWVNGQKLGICEDSMSLWVTALPKFEDRLRDACPWELDLQQYAGSEDTPSIHKYLLEASRHIYEKAE